MQSKIQQFHDALMLDLIQAEAMQGRLYTTEELSKKFAGMQADEYDWPKGVAWRHMQISTPLWCNTPTLVMVISEQLAWEYSDPVRPMACAMRAIGPGTDCPTLGLYLSLLPEQLPVKRVVTLDKPLPNADEKFFHTAIGQLRQWCVMRGAKFETMSIEPVEHIARRYEYSPDKIASGLMNSILD